MAITNAVTDLFASVYELVASFVGAAYTIVHSFVAGIANLFMGFFAFIADIFKGVFDIVGGVGKFVTGMSSPFPPPILSLPIYFTPILRHSYVSPPLPLSLPRGERSKRERGRGSTQIHIFPREPTSHRTSSIADNVL
jgi:hypothetical protein